MILYSIILITFVLLLYWVQDFRYFCFNVLNDFNEKGINYNILDRTICWSSIYWTCWSVVCFDRL